MKVIITKFAWFIHPWSNSTANMSQVDSSPMRFCIFLKNLFHAAVIFLENRLCKLLHMLSHFQAWNLRLTSLLESIDASWSIADPDTQKEDDQEIQFNSRMRRKVFKSVLGSHCLCRDQKKEATTSGEPWGVIPNPAVLMKSLLLLEAAYHVGVVAILL